MITLTGLDKTTAIIIAICVIAFLLVVFIVSFILYRKTPPPKGCEHLKIDDGACSHCTEVGCDLYATYHDKAKDDPSKEKKE
jgi:hypothetical protein